MYKLPCHGIARRRRVRKSEEHIRESRNNDMNKSDKDGDTAMTVKATGVQIVLSG